MPEEPDVRQTEPGESAQLIALIDRLEGILERSGLSELEVGSGETTLVLRSAAGLVAAASVPAEPATSAAAPVAPTSPEVDARSGHHAVVAPLTGLYYASPTPEAAPYVRVGTHVMVGQVIGLIEAMKLFNEIKSDRAGRVVRIAAENGTLVKAKQPLIELDQT